MEQLGCPGVEFSALHPMRTADILEHQGIECALRLGSLSLERLVQSRVVVERRVPVLRSRIRQ